LRTSQLPDWQPKEDSYSVRVSYRATLLCPHRWPTSTAPGSKLYTWMDVISLSSDFFSDPDISSCLKYGSMELNRLTIQLFFPNQDHCHDWIWLFCHFWRVFSLHLRAGEGRALHNNVLSIPGMCAIAAIGRRRSLLAGKEIGRVDGLWLFRVLIGVEVVEDANPVQHTSVYITVATHCFAMLTLTFSTRLSRR